jgi:hypothetical protein
MILVKFGGVIEDPDPKPKVKTVMILKLTEGL